MDIELRETSNGGDIVKNLKDLSIIFGFENMPYLAMFGGNVEASTPLQRAEGEQAFDWWGNSLFPNDASVQINSLTERTLNTVALNSQGRTLIQRAVEKDLEFMRPFADVTVDVSIERLNRVTIRINIVKKDNLQERLFIYIWDATNSELTERA